MKYLIIPFLLLFILASILANKSINELREKEKEVQECKKMGSHIDFIEKVYANVKHPLGYITNKIRYLTANEDKNKYALPDIKSE